MSRLPRLLIVDDHPEMRQLLRKFTGGCDIVGEAGDGRQAIELTEQLRPDLILMDISMPIMNGFEAARIINERVPATRIIIVSTYTGRAYVDEAFQIGAHGYVLKRAAPVDLPNAISTVLEGGVFRSPASDPAIQQGRENSSV